MRYWQKYTHTEQTKRILDALNSNIDYGQKISLGIPASKLDPEVFDDKVSFLKDAPLLQAYVQNANHIGCHTLGESEEFFKGTQQIEKEVINILSVDLFKANAENCDGYIASGGTEANIQAAWIYRNYFMKEFAASCDDIAVVASEDVHYSIPKAANLLNLELYTVPVQENTRAIIPEALNETIKRAIKDGKKYFIAISNMGSTMFGSIDDPALFARCFNINKVSFKLHVDGAFGGFIYPISALNSNINFTNEHISSITLDAHKMLQAPYGTGIFLARKGLMEYVCTKEAGYVNGLDSTLIGSRSGANAIAVWMILSTYGPYGWLEKINKLLYRTDWCCEELTKMGIMYYRHPKMNIISIKASQITPQLAHKFGLVPDHHDLPNWYKIVVMDHVELEHLKEFISDMKSHIMQGAQH